jgi:hypothetical protein
MRVAVEPQKAIYRSLGLDMVYMVSHDRTYALDLARS